MSTEAIGGAAVPNKATSRAAVFLQDACYNHNYIRSHDLSRIVELPERLRAVTIGVAAAIARLESTSLGATAEANIFPSVKIDETEELGSLAELATALGQMNLKPNALHPGSSSPVSIVRSDASMDITSDPAVNYIYGTKEGQKYLQNLKRWAAESRDNIRDKGSEIPEGLPQGDLYLCPESIVAIEGAIGTVCQAVDTVFASSKSPNSVVSRLAPPDLDAPVNRAFVAIRPPGHHCGDNAPAGFCFANNVAIGAAHAYMQYGIKRSVILDIDLHHGNGTQSIVWDINNEYYPELSGIPPDYMKNDIRVYYGSIHDILSYPCEDGNKELVQAASVSLHSHGQYIENVHLQTYNSEQHFWDVLYKEQYSKILRKAEEFLDSTGGPGDDVMIFISCGMDASEHEYETMSRHNRKVPTSFYYRFTQDACRLGDRYARGRVVSVLEGGYSDRALISGTMAHVCGLVHDTHSIDEEWWNLENLLKIEKAVKKPRGGRSSLGQSDASDAWLDKTVQLFQTLDTKVKPPQPSKGLRPPGSKARREQRTKSVSPRPTRTSQRNAPNTQVQVEGKTKVDKKSKPLVPPVEGRGGPLKATKSLPRVILRLGPEPSVSPAP